MSSFRLSFVFMMDKKKTNEARETYGDVRISDMLVNHHVGQAFYRGPDNVFDRVIVKETSLHQRYQRALGHLPYLRR